MEAYKTDAIQLAQTAAELGPQTAFDEPISQSPSASPQDEEKIELSAETDRCLEGKIFLLILKIGEFIQKIYQYDSPIQSRDLAYEAEQFYERLQSYDVYGEVSAEDWGALERGDHISSSFHTLCHAVKKQIDSIAHNEEKYPYPHTPVTKEDLQSITESLTDLQLVLQALLDEKELLDEKVLPAVFRDLVKLILFAEQTAVIRQDSLSMQSILRKYRNSASKLQRALQFLEYQQGQRQQRIEDSQKMGQKLRTDVLKKIVVKRASLSAALATEQPGEKEWSKVAQFTRVRIASLIKKADQEKAILAQLAEMRDSRRPAPTPTIANGLLSTDVAQRPIDKKAQVRKMLGLSPL